MKLPQALGPAIPGLLFLGPFLLLATAAHSGEITAAEVTLAQNIQDLLVPTLLSFFQVLNLLGEPWLVAIYGLGTVGILRASHRSREALLIFLGLLGAQSNSLLKASIARPRPDASLLEQHASVGNVYGFPSGDVQFFTIFWGLIFFLAPVFFSQRWAQAGSRGLALLMLVAVGPARVTLGVHWPTDILGGYLVGGFSLWALVGWYQRTRPAT